MTDISDDNSHKADELTPLDMIWYIQSERDRGALSFREAVYLVVGYIPVGQVLGYGHVAGLIGSPRAARQVGFALGGLPVHRTQIGHEDCVPWWRVIRSNGQIALRGDSIRPDEQASLLRAEGVEVHNYRIDMKTYAWQL